MDMDMNIDLQCLTLAEAEAQLKNEGYDLRHSGGTGPYCLLVVGADESHSCTYYRDVGYDLYFFEDKKDLDHLESIIDHHGGYIAYATFHGSINTTSSESMIPPGHILWTYNPFSVKIHAAMQHCAARIIQRWYRGWRRC